MADNVKRCERCERTDALTGVQDRWWCPEHVGDGIKLVGEMIDRVKAAASKAFDGR